MKWLRFQRHFQGFGWCHMHLLLCRFHVRLQGLKNLTIFIIAQRHNTPSLLRWRGLLSNTRKRQQ